MKHAKLLLDLDLLEEILTARNNDFVETNCPQDVKIIRVLQEPEDLVSHRVTLVLESETADWPGSRIEPGPKVVIPFLEPFEYTVIDPVKPPKTEETPP